ncbi:hypothetical protein ACFPRL_29950 [Pseudoclavibacter helvolus]
MLSSVRVQVPPSALTLLVNGMALAPRRSGASTPCDSTDCLFLLTRPTGTVPVSALRRSIHDDRVQRSRPATKGQRPPLDALLAPVRHGRRRRCAHHRQG